MPVEKIGTADRPHGLALCYSLTQSIGSESEGLLSWKTVKRLQGFYCHYIPAVLSSIHTIKQTIF